MCLSGSGRVHVSNNFTVYCGRDGTLVYRCFSEHCRAHQRVLGSVTPERRTGDAAIEYCSARCRQYTMYPDGRLQIVKSEMGTGKTYQIRELIKAMPDARVLIVCFRVELGEYMCRYLEDASS